MSYKGPFGCTWSKLSAKPLQFFQKQSVNGYIGDGLKCICVQWYRDDVLYQTAESVQGA